MPKSTTASNETPGFAQNPEYSVSLLLWTKCRDSAAGQDRIHARRETYLPMLSGMDKADYASYLLRAMFFNAMGRTLSGLVGMVMRKPFALEYPSAAESDLDTIGVADEPLKDMITRTLQAQLMVGRIGHLVDAANVKEGESDGDLEPYVSEYEAESIWNWHEERINGVLKLSLVVLHETYEELTGPKHAIAVLERFRVLRLGIDPAVTELESDVRDENGNVLARKGSYALNEGFTESDLDDPFYYQETWVYARDAKGETTDEIVLESVIVPKMSAGRLLTEIPFQFTNVASAEPSPEKPPLLDMVNVGLSHYLNSADLEWGRHWTCLPTPWVAGGDPEKAPRIGSSVAWVMPDADAKVGMLEFTGAGLGHLKDGMEHKEKLMAMLGSRLLADDKPGVEAAAAIKLRMSGDSAVLSTIAAHCSSSWVKILEWVWEWTNIGEAKIKVELNTDFNPARLGPQDLAVLMAGLQGGTIDFPTWFYNLEKGDILPPGMTLEEFTAGVEAGIPGAPSAPAVAPGALDDPDEPDDDDDPDPTGKKSDDKADRDARE